MTKTTFRNFIDLDPTGGDSFWGLRREHAKAVAIIFVFIGLMLADPPGGLLPNDFMNIFLAGWLFKHVGLMSQYWWLVMTYTVIAWGLVLIGAYIYPHNTARIMRGSWNRFVAAFKKQLKNPIPFIILLIITYFIFKWYMKVLM